MKPGRACAGAGGSKTPRTGFEISLINTRDRRLAAVAVELGRLLAREFPHARGAQACVVFTDDATITALNRRYRHRNVPTDVLSFPMRHPDPDTGRRTLGEVYIARARAREQGREFRTGYYGELRRLILHGLLHLLGLSHREMRAVDRKLEGNG